MRLTTALLLSCFFVFSGCQAVPDANSTPHFSNTRAELELACREDRFSGIVRALQFDEVIFEFACTGGQKTTPPITENTRFKIFSTSKHFTATVIMSLVEDDVLSLSDPVTRWIDAAPEAWKPVTIKDLLRHQSGLPDLTGLLLEQYKNGARDHSQAVVDTVMASQDVLPIEKPTWSYNNFNYELLVLVAENASNKRFERLLRDRLFARAGMGDTVIEQPAADPAILASAPDNELVQGYNGVPNEVEVATSFAFVQRGAGGLHSSMEDLSNYLFALREDAILSSEVQDIMRRDAVDVSETTRNGIGWFIRNQAGYEILSHSGGTNGYVSQLTYMPDLNAGFVILSNYGFASTRDVQSSLINELITE